MRTRSPDYVTGLTAILCLFGAVPSAAQAFDETPLVVIDAGHGGPDPGAVGTRGTREKDVTLAIARELEIALRAFPTLDVRMIRDRDTLIALRDRPRLANQWRRASSTAGRPSLFISIHANAHRDRTVRGVETYFLSEAKTEDARRVAEMENAAEAFDAPVEDSDALSFIFKDLRQNLYLRESSDGAAIVQQWAAGGLGGPNRGVKQAGFVVLDGANMPAILVEVGFLTNREEEALLLDRAVQQSIAQRLASAIEEFFARAGTSSVTTADNTLPPRMDPTIEPRVP